MSVLNIELSEYDAMRNRNKELEDRVKQLEKELEGCKDGSRVIIRKVMEQKEEGRFSHYDHLVGRPIYGSGQTKEIVVSENYINFEDVRVKIEDKMKEAVEASIRYHNEEAENYNRKANSLDIEYSEKKNALDKKFDDDTKSIKEKLDKTRTELENLKRFSKSNRTAIYNLANEALERLESMWFKPSHAISLVREIANMTK